MLSTFWSKQLIHKLQKLDQFIVLTQEDKEDWKEVKKISVIPNPLPFYPETFSQCTQKNVIAVGRFSHEKGFDLLAQAGKSSAGNITTGICNYTEEEIKLPYTN